MHNHHDQASNVQGKNKAASDQEANAGLTKEQRMERWDIFLERW